VYLKVGKWKVDTSTLFRVEWRLPFPKIYLHERFEKIAKWTSRTIVTIGILVSLLALPTVYDFIVAIVLLALEVLVEKIIFEYSVIIVQPFPDFEVDESQWITNGYLFPNPAFRAQYDLQNHFGPCYKDEAYARQFFEYLKSWNELKPTDPDNNICLSFILEEDNSYTTYIYANPNRKWLDEAFNTYQELNKVEKYGKIQQSMVMQMVYWKTLPNKKGTMFHSFTADQANNELFHFCPFYMSNNSPVALEDLIIKKYHYSFKKRADVVKGDLEYYYGPTIKIDISKKREISINPQKLIEDKFTEQLLEILQNADSIEFTLADDYERSPPIIGVIFSDYNLAFRSYGMVVQKIGRMNGKAEIKRKKDHINLVLQRDGQKLKIKKLAFDRSSLKTFKLSEQSKASIVLMFGLKEQGQTIFVSTESPFSPMVLKRVVF
jgi:hypothetical protein